VNVVFPPNSLVTNSLIGRFSVDSFETHCENERDSKEEAIRDANEFVERRRQGRERRRQGRERRNQ
jgi:hypothetical protein